MRTNEVASSSSLVFSNSSTRLSSSFFERGVCTKRVLKVTTRMQKNGDTCFLALKKNCVFGSFKKLCLWVLQKIFSVQNKKRRKTTRDTTCSALSSIPSGGPPGNTHAHKRAASFPAAGHLDARLEESVLSTDECLCDACCARFSSTPNFVVLFSYFGLTENIFSAKP